MSQAHQLQFAKEKTALKYYLIGRGYDKALKALGFAERYHVGLRKDGKTPEFHHQIRIALAITQLKGILNEERCIILALLHDVQEDYQIPHETISMNFGVVIADKVWKLTKKFEGEIKNKLDYIEQIALDADCSIVKGLDRCDNLESMIGVFSVSKMEEYAHEAVTIFLKMLRKASKLFPEQHPAYQAIMQRMKTVIKFVESHVAVLHENDKIQQFLQQARKDMYSARESEKDMIVQQRCSWALTNSKNSTDHDEKVKSMIDIIMKEAVTPENRKDLCVQIYRAISSHKNLMSTATINEVLNIIRTTLGISELELQEFKESIFKGPIPAR